MVYEGPAGVSRRPDRHRPFLPEASRFGTRRWYVLGAVYLASGFLVQYLPGERHYTHIIGSQLTSLGGITLVWGIALFARFLKKYPVLAEEGHDAAR